MLALVCPSPAAATVTGVLTGFDSIRRGVPGTPGNSIWVSAAGRN